MKHIITSSVISLLFALLLSCAAQKKVIELGILRGTIGVYEGNCMPSPGRKPCEPRPISTLIYITSPSKEFNSIKLVDSIQSLEDGSFSLKLAPGNYSLFIKDNEEVVCSIIQCPSECFCNPFEIVSDSTTIIDTNLDHASW